MKRIILLFSLVLSLLPNLGNAEVRKPKTITAIIDVIQRGRGFPEWVNEYEKLTGIKLEVTNPQHNEYSQKLKLLLASGNAPDIIEIPVGDYVSLASQGSLYPLDALISNSEILKSIDKKYFETYRMPNGKIYGFPMDAGSGCVGYIRKDWLDKLGLKIPADWDEFYTVLQAFTTKDPDGNGKNDTAGYTLALDVPVAEFDNYNRFIMQDAFFNFTKKGSKWVDGFTEKEMVGALERFRKLYKEGLIDPEFFTNTTALVRNKYFAGKYGFIEYWSGSWAKKLDESTKRVNSKANVISIDPINGVKYTARTGGCFGIYSKSRYAEAAFKYWIEFQVDKGPGQLYFTCGVKGVQYDIVDGKYVWLTKSRNPKSKDYFDKMYIEPAFVLNDWKVPITLDKRILRSREINKANSVSEQLALGGDKYGQYVADIWKLKQQIFSLIVIGDISIESGLNLYREKVKAFYLDDMIEELNSIRKK
jgi:putative aldouronate transport system substrate-binding protein